MRSQIMVISRNAALRARLAQLLTRSGYRAEVAESAAQARRTGLDRIALAILATDGVGGEHTAAVEELRAAVGRALIVAPPNCAEQTPIASTFWTRRVCLRMSPRRWRPTPSRRSQSRRSSSVAIVSTLRATALRTPLARRSR